jgi:hypothetical protein
MNEHDDLLRFADGELDPERAEAFRAHLQSCDACRGGLIEMLQLGARLNVLGATAGRMTLVPETPAPPAAPSPAPVLPPPSRSKRNLRRAVWIAPAAAAAAAVVVWVSLPPQDAFAALHTRPYDIRFAYAAAGRYLPKREEQLGTQAPSADRLSHDTLGKLERRGDRYGLAIAQAINGQNPSEVAAQLEQLDPTPEVRSDRAAIAILARGDLANRNDSVEAVLAELESLEQRDDAVGRAARWNYAVAVARLGLPLSAAQAFQAIADAHEPGWSDEARTRAAHARAQDGHKDWDGAITAGEALVTEGTPVAPDLVRRFPGVMRAYFYSAVCAAPSRERVQSLQPMAAELDRLDEHPLLGDYLRRVADLDFTRRAPLAAAYAQVRQGAQVAAAVKAQLTDPEPSRDVVDIVMCAMFELEVVADHLDAFRSMVKQAGDPWWEIVLAQNEATVDQKHGDYLGAEARLRKAQKLCVPAVNYRCLSLARQLGTLYEELHRVPEAVVVLHAGLRDARSSGEWGQTLSLLLRLADVERFNASFATVRAYGNELLLMSPGPDRYSPAIHMLLAGAAVRDLDSRTARRELALATRGDAPDLRLAVDYLADLGQIDPQPGDLAQLQRWLAELRSSPTITPSDRILFDEIEGRLLAEHDRAAGVSLLERAIAGAQALHDLTAEKARTAAYSALALDAARHREPAQVMAFLAQQLGLPPPPPCSVAMVADYERAVVVVRGNDGRDQATYQSPRRQRDDLPIVAPELARRLEGCGHVRVMASPMLQGRSRILPPAMPWSYTVGSHGHRVPQGAAPASPLAVIVSNVTPPDYLQLPALSPWMSNPPQRTVKLSGPTATPARVRAEIVDATEIQFHTHALVNAGVSDASHLVLSQGSDGSYALTAEAIRGTEATRGIELRGHPIVVLAACRSAQGALYQHASWSLPDAFLSVGASAVLAATTTIPDQEAAAFFARVLERTRAGADPAVALRDARMAPRAPSWAADVILFE